MKDAAEVERAKRVLIGGADDGVGVKVLQDGVLETGTQYRYGGVQCGWHERMGARWGWSARGKWGPHDLPTPGMVMRRRSREAVPAEAHSKGGAVVFRGALDRREPAPYPSFVAPDRASDAVGVEPSATKGEPSKLPHLPLDIPMPDYRRLWCCGRRCPRRTRQGASDGHGLL